MEDLATSKAAFPFNSKVQFSAWNTALRFFSENISKIENQYINRDIFISGRKQNKEEIRLSLKRKVLPLMVISLLIPAAILIGQTRASAEQLEVPASSVTIEVFNSTRAYFDTKLIMEQTGFDVTNNKVYLGWCIDRTADMERSPTTHKVYLYSSLNAPGIFADQQWDKVNYILNHKQGEPQDVQEAIWYFINLNGGYTTDRTLAKAMINDATANGAGFIPNDTHPIIAVICNPTTQFPGAENVQISIIEVTIPTSSSEPTSPSQTPTTPSDSTPDNSPPPEEPDQTPTTPDNTDNTDNGSQDTLADLGDDVLAGIAVLALLPIIGIIAALLMLRRTRKK